MDGPKIGGWRGVICTKFYKNFELSINSLLLNGPNFGIFFKKAIYIFDSSKMNLEQINKNFN